MSILNRAEPPPITPVEYEIWRDFIHQRCGLWLSERRLEFLRGHLWERMQARRISSYGEYYYFVTFNPAGEQEWERLQERLLIYETGFFRHPPSFRALADFLLPDLLARRAEWDSNDVTMWSAGCATGPEAYSLAMTFLDSLAQPDRWQLRVTGTDISRTALARAKAGVYRPTQVRFMPAHYRDTYLVRLESDGGGENAAAFSEHPPALSLRDPTRYRVRDDVRALVRFGYLNLNDPASYWVSAQDIIFCQNVLIYFKPECRADVVQRLCQRLNPGGYLFLAPAEVVGLKLPGVQPVRLPDSLIYQRTR